MSEKLEDARKLLDSIHHGVLCMEQAERHLHVTAAALAAAEARGHAAALAGCVPVPRELVQDILEMLDEHGKDEYDQACRDLAADLRALPGSEGNEATG